MATNGLCCIDWPHLKVPWLGAFPKTHGGASRGIAELSAQEFRDLDEALREDGDFRIAFVEAKAGFEGRIPLLALIALTLKSRRNHVRFGTDCEKST